MRTSIVFLILGPLSAFCQQLNSGSVNREVAEVEKTIKAWNKSFAGNNADDYFRFVHDGITVFLPSCPFRIDGKQNDREEFEYALNKGWSSVGYFQDLQMKTQLIGNTAIVTYHCRATYGKGVDEKTVYLKETDVLVKENGSWKVVHVHVSGTR